MTETINAEGKSLKQYVAELATRGYQVMTINEDTAQLRRPKKFSALWALVWFLGLGVGIIFYLIYYAAKKDDTAYLSEENGRVSGHVEYTRIRYQRLLIGVGLGIGALVIMGIGGAAGGGVGTVFAFLGFFALLAGLGFGVASLFGWRRREQIGQAF